MKNRKKIVLSIIMIFAFLFTGCGKKASEFSRGNWNGHVYENSWLNMKFTIPDDWKIASDEEISAIVGVGMDQIKLDGPNSEQLKKAAQIKTTYSFVVSEPDGTINAQLMYENLKLSVGGTSYDEKKYLDSALDLLQNQTQMQYKLIEKKSIEIAGKTFETARLSVYDGSMEQMYYCYKKDNFMVNMVVSYVPDQTDAKDAFVQNISTLN